MNPPVRFLHTADWQLGKPFGRVTSPDRQARLRRERIDVIGRIGEVAAARGARFVVVAGDVFDSFRPSRETLADACGAIGRLKLPVYVIPGNHDPAGRGGFWEEPFFVGQQRDLAPNLHVVLEARPLQVEGAVLFPCPLRCQHELDDPTAWLRVLPEEGGWDPDLPRIVLAHGSVRSFESFGDDEEAAGGGMANRLQLERLPAGCYDYIALGDWHGTLDVGSHAWYPGTPEVDRFPKARTNDPGNVLVVDAARGRAPVVDVVRTTRLEWLRKDWDLGVDGDLDALCAGLEQAVGGHPDRYLLHLRVRGALGLEELGRLEDLVETWRARLIRLRAELGEVVPKPGEDELESLTRRPADPLTRQVALRLLERLRAGGEADPVAREALRVLHRAVKAASGGAQP